MGIVEIFRNLIAFFKDYAALIGVFSAFGVYMWQLRVRRKEAAALIILQIENLKEKLKQIRDISINDTINETAFYETIDFLVDNQWDKYKHIFVKRIDSYSFKTINEFYEAALSVREQLLFVKQLQHQQYFNIQGMIDSNCNAFILDTLNISNEQKSIDEIKNFISNQDALNESEVNQKELMLKVIDELKRKNPNCNSNKFWNIYSIKKELMKEVVNGNPYIQYIPKQVSLTFNKAIRDINSIEIIGSEGYRKLKKIAKMK